MEPYRNLANAIILSGVDEYRKRLEKLKYLLKTPEINDFRINEINRQIEKLEKFFRSEWFGELTNISGEDIINKARKEIAI
jgi:hypothetical protein